MKKPDFKKIERSYKINNVEEKYGDNKITTTKYTLITFIPKNLIEQFSKIANVYFVILIILQTINVISISGGTPTILPPLLAIISISALKDFFEDYKRKKSDKEENFSSSLVFEKGKWIEKKWKDLMVGNIIKIKNNELVPADVLVLFSSEKGGKCFIETKNLDGETNLKNKEVSKELQEFITNEENLYKIFNYDFNYEKANPLLYQFTGSIDYDSKKIAIDNDNFILRGCLLRNTKYIIGSVSFNGHYTKIMMNSVSARPKKSLLEIQTNKFIILLFLILVFFCTTASLLYVVWLSNNIFELEYIFKGIQISYFKEFLIRIGNWILIFGNFVPISLLVTIESVKFIQAILISKDKNLFSIKNQTYCQVQSSNLNEELGQIEFIFSDKTGTLTCNEMIFKKILVKDVPYGIEYDKSIDLKDYTEVTNVDFKDPNFFKKINTTEIREYALFLALCHTIIIEKTEKNEIIYNASSPDELALANFAKMIGCEFLELSDEGLIKINNFGELNEFKLLYVLEFNSDRKRMSIIIKDKNNKIKLLCKGADNVILSRINKNDASFDLNILTNTLDTFAKEGLRTLLLASKEINNEDYEQWKIKYEEARNDIDNKIQKMADLQEEIEKNLKIVGATAIEDKLQDQVENCIDSFKKAGIKVWVLTGDKIETAKTIGFSCNLLNNDMIVYEIIQIEIEEIKNKIEEYLKLIDVEEIMSKKAIVVSGESLIKIMEDKVITKKLNELAQKCEAVLCCRVSPIQKQQIVRMVRDCLPNARTLSIGDGANDVNMIIEAHVGVGIKGVEGQQAARSSDYSIGEFKHLRRLLFYYGRESYRKNSIMVLYNFYKNIVLCLPQFWYAMFYENFSGVTLYDAFLYQLPNIFYTSMPIVLYAILDKDLEDKIIEKNYKLYIPGLKRLFFNIHIFILWLCIAGTHALIIALMTSLINLNNSNNKTEFGFWGYGIIVFTLTIYTGNLKILILSNSFYFFNWFVLIGSMFIFYISVLSVSLSKTNEHYGLFSQIFFNLTNILIIVLSIILCSFMDYLFDSAFKVLFLRNINEALENEKLLDKKFKTINKYKTYEATQNQKNIESDDENIKDEKEIPVQEININKVEPQNSFE